MIHSFHAKPSDWFRYSTHQHHRGHVFQVILRQWLVEGDEIKQRTESTSKR